VFHDVIELFSGRKYPTINLFFHDICDIKVALISWLSNEKQIIRDMALKMIDKFDKYWSTINGVLAVAAILDPRDKLACVEFYFEVIYGDKAYGEIQRVKVCYMTFSLSIKDVVRIMFHLPLMFLANVMRWLIFMFLL